MILSRLHKCPRSSIPVSFAFGILLAICPYRTGQAALIAADNFSYPDGFLGEKNGGEGNWVSRWNDGFQAEPLYRVTSGLTTLTNRNTGEVGENNGNYVYRLFAETTPSQTIYFSAHIGTTGVDSFYSNEISLTNNNSSGYLGMGISNGQFVLTIDDLFAVGVFEQSVFGTYIAGQTHLLVGKLEFNVNGAASERATMWVDPTGTETSALTSSVVGPIGTSTINNLRATSFIQNRGGSGVLDNVRVGTQWADVVPEPFTIGLLGIGAAFLTNRRSRA